MGATNHMKRSIVFFTLLLASTVVAQTPSPVTGASNSPLNIGLVNGVAYVGNGPAYTSAWGSSDIMTQLTAAYAALPSTGGRIHIAPSATTYNTANTFSATTAGKPVTIECDPGGATILNFTPASGTMFTFDTRLNSSQHPVGQGMRDCVLTTNAGSPTSTAISLGSTNSGEGYEIDRTKIELFQTDVAVVGTPSVTGSFANLFENDVFRSSVNGILGSGSVEMSKVFGGSFFNITGAAISGAGDFLVNGTSCDDPGAGGCIGNGVVATWVGGHFENPGGGLPVYVNTNGQAYIYGGEALDDTNSGTNATSWFSGTTSAYMDISLNLVSAGRTLTTSLVSVGGSSRAWVRFYNNSPSNITPICSASSVQFNVCSDMSYASNAGVLATWMSLRLNGTTTGLTLPTAGTLNLTNAGNILWENAAQGGTIALAKDTNDLFSFGTQHVPQVLTLTSQYTNSTTGFTNVAGGNTIQFNVLANANYTATCHLYYQAAATGGLNIEFTGPASPTAVIYGLNDPSAATTLNTAVATAYSTPLGQAAGTNATNFDAIVSFSLLNAANDGTVNLLAKSSAAAQLQIQSGSYCQVQ
jgi:hypothetical protein